MVRCDCAQIRVQYASVPSDAGDSAAGGAHAPLTAAANSTAATSSVAATGRRTDLPILFQVQPALQVERGWVPAMMYAACRCQCITGCYIYGALCPN